jgi:hypothetical protein
MKTRLIAVVLVAAAVAAFAFAYRSDHFQRMQTVRSGTGVRSTGALWRKDVASHDMDHGNAASLIAIAAGQVAVETPAHRICSLRERDGEATWCIDGARAPVADDHAFLIVTDNAVERVDAATGSRSWRFAFPEGAAAFAAPIGGGLVLAAAASAPGNGRPTTFAINAHGRPRWSASVPGIIELPHLIADRAFLPTFGDGATFEYRLVDVARAEAHPIVATVHGVRPPLLALGSNVVAVADAPFTFDHPALENELEFIDASTGGITAHATFAPDLDENRTRFEVRDATHRALPRSVIRFERHYAYMSVVDRIYRYDLERASLPPLRISDDGAFAGGPVDDTIYVARADGLWSLHVATSRVAARLVAASREPFAAMTIDGDRAYVAFADGSMRGFATHDGSPVFAAVAACPPFALVTSATTLYALCRTPAWSVSAFART